LKPYSGKGIKPSLLKEIESHVRIEYIIMNTDTPWSRAVFGIGSAGPVEERINLSELLTSGMIYRTSLFGFMPEK
jgi:hypothetical protein